MEYSKITPEMKLSDLVGNDTYGIFNIKKTQSPQWVLSFLIPIDIPLLYKMFCLMQVLL
jgi:hypothetical protein